MSKERRYISQRKIRRIKRSSDDSTLKLESEIRPTKPRGIAPNTKLYYTKVAFGITTGIIAGFLFLLSKEFPSIWLVILIAGLIICVIFVRHVLKISDDELDQKRVWLSGTFTFVILFIVVASLIWMLPNIRF